jgi:hypothetical protein
VFVPLALDTKKLADIHGRLFIAWANRGWKLFASRNDKNIVRLGEEPDPVMPDLLDFETVLSELEKLPLTHKAILSKASGVYLFTNVVMNEKYVGIAYGDEGFLRRWQMYADTGHGGNVAMVHCLPHECKVSILEEVGTDCTLAELQRREVRWKKKLGTRENGLNRN